MKKIFITFCAVISVFNLMAQKDESRWDNGLPKAGDMAIGVNFNPVATSKSVRNITSPGNFVGDKIVELNNKDSYPDQMFFLAQDPMVSLQFKYMLNDHSAFKVRAGFSGAVLNYREYVRNDAAFALDELTQEVVTDLVRCQFTNGGVTLGMEFSKGNRLRFVGGFGLVYAFGGGNMNYFYGNAMNAYNPQPSTMSKVDDKLNEFKGNAAISYARPIKQYTSGICHAVGINGDLGVEWFFIPKVSLGAELSIVPIMVAFQPQTYINYEGVNRFTGNVQEFSNLISEGSTYLLYGTNNISLNISLHLYF